MTSPNTSPAGPRNHKRLVHNGNLQTFTDLGLFAKAVHDLGFAIDFLPLLSLNANFIDDGQRLWLLDWEYAGFNSPLFDLGGLASNSELSPEQAEQALSLYFGKPVDDRLRTRAAAMTAASLLRETIWSMVSEIHSTVDFDYAAYTAENLIRFEAAYATYLTMDRA